MIERTSLAVLFAVLAVAARPAVTGGAHDLLVVGVRVEDSTSGTPVQRLALGMPEGKAREAYELLLRSPAREALVQGSTVYAPAPADPGTGPRVIEVIYYGTASRPGRSPIVFTGPAGGELPGAAEALAAARSLAALPGPVTAAAARVLLRTGDVDAYRDALEALASVEADGASAEAIGTALDPSAPVLRRVVAIRILKRIGGAASRGDVFRKLAADPEPLVSEAAK